MFILHPGSGIPLYRQVVEQVRRLVASGQLAEGAALPSVRELALEHAVNPMTISKAYSQLEAEGLLQRHRGKPMTVAGGQGSQASPSRRVRQIEPQALQLVAAARQLDLSPADLAALIDRSWRKKP